MLLVAIATVAWTLGLVHRFCLIHYRQNVPQSSVLGHSFAPGFVPVSQLDVLQLTVPGVPDNPAPMPHLVAHPLGSPCTQLPKVGT